MLLFKQLLTFLKRVVPLIATIWRFIVQDQLTKSFKKIGHNLRQYPHYTPNFAVNYDRKIRFLAGD